MIEDSRSVSGSSPIFDVFLCHNSEDKPVVREIAQKLSEEAIKPWLDEADIRAGSFWHTAIGRQIETVKSAAVFVGQHGVGPWQNREIIALLDQFDRRGCPVIPAILPSAPAKVDLPWSLVGHHCVDFRAKDSYPLKRLIWGITGEKPVELSDVPSSQKPATIREAAKSHLLQHGDDHATDKTRFRDSEISETRLHHPLDEPPDKEDARQLEILRRRVTEYWVDGVLKHSLYREVLISLGKRQIDEAIDAPWKYKVEVSGAANSVSLEHRDVSTVYDATGLLLILGEPGSGKTTTLLELTRILLERARDDIKERVPVVLNLSSWKKKQPLVEWISGELSEKYRMPRKIARFWLEQDYLLPFLDGLDEVEMFIQPDCVTAINVFIDESTPSGLVVCCRFNEYRWLPERLKLNGAILLEPLSEHEVADYLRKGGSELATLREAVNADSVLQDLAQTPLMLSIMSLACQGAGGDELARQKGDSPEERRKQIFGLYFEKMFQRKGTTSLVFPKENVMGRLSWLARRMREHSQSVFLVEGLQPSWLCTKAQRVAYGTVLALSLGLIPGLFLGLFLGLMVGLVDGRSEEVFVALSLPPLLGMAVGLLLAQSYRDRPFEGFDRITLVETMSWNWNQFWKRTIRELRIWLIGGMIVGLSVGLFGGSIAEQVGGSSLARQLAGERPDPPPGPYMRGGPVPQPIPGPTRGPIFGLIYGVFIGLFVALSFGFAGGFTDRVNRGKAFPNQGIRLTGKNALVAFVVAWLFGGLLIGLSSGLLSGLSVGLYFGRSEGLFVGLSSGLYGGLLGALCVGLFGGLCVGLFGGLHRGGSAVIKHYTLRLILFLNGYTPFKFVNFLDHCARLILLKKVGGGYIFIHRMLLDYFAELPPVQASATAIVAQDTEKPF